MQEVQGEFKNDFERMQEEARANALESLKKTMKEIEENDRRGRKKEPSKSIMDEVSPLTKRLFGVV